MEQRQLTAPWQVRLDSATSLADLCDVVRRSARTGCASEGATFVLREDDKCFYVERGRHRAVVEESAVQAHGVHLGLGDASRSHGGRARHRD